MPKPLALVVALAACSSEPTVPTSLEVTSPARAAVSSTSSIAVAGTVHGSGAIQVTVNGAPVTPAADGTFSTTVDVGNGVGIIETHAIDGDGTDLRDVRAVLAGTLGTTDGSAAAPIGARIAPAGLTAIGNVLATDAEAIDFTAEAKQFNPVYNNTGCLGATINITSVSLSKIDVALAPTDGALDANVTIHDVAVKLHASYKVACIGGSADVTIRASKARIHGSIGVTVKAGKLVASLPTDSVALDDFSLDVSGLPSFVEGLFNNEVRNAIQNSLASIIKSKLPPLADGALASVIAKPVTANVLGRDFAFAVMPATVTIASTGLWASADTTVTVTDGTGGMYVTAPSPISPDLVGGGNGLGIAVAADLVDQLFGGLHAAGAFDTTQPVSALGPLAAILDPSATTLDISLKLPPTVTTADDKLLLSIGELVVTAKDAAGAPVQQIVLALRSTIAAGPSQSGKLLLTLGMPEVHAQILAQSDAVTRPLTDDQVQAIVMSVWNLVGGAAGDALAKLPMPSVAGVQLGAPAVTAKTGYVIANVSLGN